MSTRKKKVVTIPKSSKVIFATIWQLKQDTDQALPKRTIGYGPIMHAQEKRPPLTVVFAFSFLAVHISLSCFCCHIPKSGSVRTLNGP